MRQKVIVSACLAGKKCRYNGESKEDARIADLVRKGEAVAACPELLGGLSVPRVPCEIKGGDGVDVLQKSARVYNKKGCDVTEAFLSGARAFCQIAREFGCTHALLADKSPSCGAALIYDGSFSGTVKRGMGVTAALLLENGIKVSNNGLGGTECSKVF